MADVLSVSVSAAAPSVEEDAAALAAAAATAPTNEAEARALIAAEEAAKSGKARPEGIPEKFWDAEKGEVRVAELAKSYSELEKAKGAPVEEAAADDEIDEEALKPDELEIKDGDEPKFSLAVFDTEYADNGALSEESYATLEAKGFDKATVDGYIAGQEALAEIATQKITAAAGGQDGMDTMFAWAKTSLTATEIDDFNDKFAHADVNTAVIAMEQLKAKYEAANGKEGVVLGGRSAATATDQFGSWAEVTQAMSDERYNTDSAYREKVAAKLGRSNPK